MIGKIQILDNAWELRHYAPGWVFRPLGSTQKFDEIFRTRELAVEAARSSKRVLRDLTVQDRAGECFACESMDTRLAVFRYPDGNPDDTGWVCSEHYNSPDFTLVMDYVQVEGDDLMDPWNDRSGEFDCNTKTLYGDGGPTQLHEARNDPYAIDWWWSAVQRARHVPGGPGCQCTVNPDGPIAPTRPWVNRHLTKERCPD